MIPSKKHHPTSEKRLLTDLASLPLSPARIALLASRLVRISKITSEHISKIPSDADHLELQLRAQFWAQSLLEVLGIRIHLERPEELPERALVVSNHRSFADIIVLLSLIPSRFLAKDDVKNWAVIGKAAKSVDTLFVKREEKTSRRKTREAIEEALREGSAVSIFPEGTTTRPPGCKMFKRGSFEVATKVGAPVIPVAIEYRRDDVWLNEPVWVNFGRTFSRKVIDVYVGIGDPIVPRRVEAEDVEGIRIEGDRVASQARDWIQRYLIKIWPIAQG